MNKDTKFLLIFGSIFTAIGTIIAVTGIIIGLKTRSFVATAIPAQGTIIELVQRWSTDNGRFSYEPIPLIKSFESRCG
ncbi:hypothetical protein NIES25_50250 [Nostoc linckia NIES-25]|nr:hypothetical protein NIES25_50250 [Nostoc linckia NIES-25]